MLSFIYLLNVNLLEPSRLTFNINKLLTMKYPLAYKEMCVALVLEKKLTLKEAASKMGVPSSSLSDWVQLEKRNKNNEFEPYKKYSQQLEKEMAKLTEEVLFLKKRCCLLFTTKSE